MKIIQPSDAIIFYHHYPKALLSFVSELGLETEKVKQDIGLSDELEQHASSRITYNQYKALIQYCIDALSMPALGLHFGRRLMFSHGFVGQCSLACNTVGEALEIIQTYKKLISPITVINVIRHPSTAHLTCTPAIEGGDIQHFFTELLFSTLYHCFLYATGRKTMECTFEFSIEKPIDADAYYQLLGDNVKFGSHRNQITCAPSLFDIPLSFPNPAMIQEVTQRSSQLLGEFNEQEGLLTHIRQYIAQHPNGYPSIEHVAQHFNTSKSTLKRRLKELNVTYTQLLQDSRRDLACDFLERGELTVDDITQRLQFSEAAAFRRAFKQWTGYSPSTYRDTYLTHSL